ncbi:MAG: TolC family protein [Deltaproteobacteria bacterium]|nr:TolC family protein [Deltaproteobacteria bacterium]
MKKRQRIYLYLFLCLILFPYTALCDNSISDIEESIKKALEISKSIDDEINNYLKIENLKDKSAADIQNKIKNTEKIDKSIKKTDNAKRHKEAELPKKTFVKNPKISQTDKINTDKERIIKNDINASATLNLDHVIKKTIEASLKIKSAQEETKAADAVLFSQKTKFLPSVSGGYKYTYNDEARAGENLKEQSTLSATVSQPILTGFLLKNQHRIADYALKNTEFNLQLIREEVVLDAKEKYFSILKAEKLYSVAKDTVEQITSHKNVSENFYNVGMVPLNYFLKAEVRLANAKQMLISVENNLEIAKIAFNTLLRRPVDTPVILSDVENYTPFDRNFDSCLKSAKKNRIELKIADIGIRIAESSVRLAEGGGYPSVSINGNFYKIGKDWNARQAAGIDPNRWDITALASWELFDWGKTYFERKEKKHYVKIAKNQKEELEDQILIEVKSYFLKVKEAEINIKTSGKAVEQAKENFRINKEQYKEQMATSTDVLDAQTLLTETMTNYYNALYNFSISKSRLEKAMGL